MNTELIARLEAAEVGSGELDALVYVTVANDPNTYVVDPHPDSMFSHKPGWYRTGNDLSVLADPITTSLDAALALAERVLPDVIWRVERFDDKAFDAAIWDDPLDNRIGFGRATAPAIALCIAILRVLDAQEQK